MSQREHMTALLERSSLGTPGARSLRARTDPQAVRRVLERVRERKTAASLQLDRAGVGQHSSSHSGSGGHSTTECAPASLACELVAPAVRTQAAAPVAVSLREFVLACSIGDHDYVAAREARERVVAAVSRVVLAPPGCGKSTALALGLRTDLRRASIERGLGVGNLLVHALDAEVAGDLGVARAHRIRAYMEAALGRADADATTLLQDLGRLAEGRAELPSLLADSFAAELRGSSWHRTQLQQPCDVDLIDLAVVPIAGGDRPAGLHIERKLLRRWQAGSLDVSSPLPWTSAEALLSHGAGGDLTAVAAQRLITAALQQAYGTVRRHRRSVFVAFAHEELQPLEASDLLVPTVIGLREPLDEQCAAMVASALYRRLRGGAAPADALRMVLTAAAGSYADALVEHHAALWLYRGISTAAQATRWALWRRCSSTLWRWRDATDQSPAATGAGEQATTAWWPGWPHGPGGQARLTEPSAGQADGDVVLFTPAANRLATVGDTEVDVAAALERLRDAGLQPQVLGVHRLTIPGRGSKVS